MYCKKRIILQAGLAGKVGCVTIRTLYRDCCCLNRKELYCKMVKCIAIEVAGLGENCIAIQELYCKRYVGWVVAVLYCNTRECIVDRKGFEAALYRNTIDCIVTKAGHGLYCNTATVSCDTAQAQALGVGALGVRGAQAGERGQRCAGALGAGALGTQASVR